MKGFEMAWSHMSYTTQEILGDISLVALISLATYTRNKETAEAFWELVRRRKKRDLEK